MQFVEKNLTKHHLLHAPHKWFLAFLISPIHAAELHYQQKYHLNFRHAKKLFFFDMSLLAFIVFLFGATLFWHFYDPTVRSLVTLTVEQSTERIKTGTEITYTVSYINRSDVALTSPLLSVQFPHGFILNTSTSAQNFNTENSSLTLSDLAPGANGSLTLVGTLFGTPDEHYDTIVKLSYIQEGEETREYVIDRIISSPRDTPLRTEWNIGETALARGTLPFAINLSNTGSESLQEIRLALPTISGIQFEIATTSLGNYQGSVWSIPVLDATTTTTLRGNIITNLSTNNPVKLEISPTLRVNNIDFPQKKIIKNLEIITPSLEARALWGKETLVAKPLELVPLSINLKNTNEYNLENISFSIPLTNSIDKVRIGHANKGVVRNNTFVINQSHLPELKLLKSGQTVHIDLSIPLSNFQSGNDVIVRLTPEVQATLPLIQDAIYREKITTPEIKVATSLGLTGELRYYTDEGDQLGRGPLPPQVGNETKYFATVVLSNSTSDVADVSFSATLPAGIEWADKTSVTFGKDVTYNSATRKISWSAALVPAHTTIGISFALSFTPTADMIGKTVPAVTNITVSGTDGFTKLPVSSIARNIDTSLPQDEIGKAKGVNVAP